MQTRPAGRHQEANDSGHPCHCCPGPMTTAAVLALTGSLPKAELVCKEKKPKTQQRALQC